MNKFFMHKVIIFAGLTFIVFPGFAVASEINLETNKTEVKVQEQFVVNVLIQSDELINAVEGRIIYPKEIVSVQEIRDGNSVINLWLKNPNVTSEGEISFSGITPGGFSGVGNRVFSVVFEAKSEGIVSIGPGSVKVLQNDGFGTESEVITRGVKVSINSGGGGVLKENIVDTESPESFNPMVAESEGIYDGKNFIVFTTQDKGSGINHYEIKESRFPMFSFLFSWVEAESPYLLKDQDLKSHIFVRAIDNVGNDTVVEVMPTNRLSWYEYLFYWVIIAVTIGVAFFATLKVWKRIFT